MLKDTVTLQLTEMYMGAANGVKVRTILRAHALLGPSEMDFIDGMGAVGGQPYILS